jgi:hypothetical protein
MVSSPSSYSPFDPLASPPSTTNSNNSVMGAGDDTSVFCQPSPSASPPTYNSNYDFANPTPSDRSFSYATDRPSALPIVPSNTSPTAYAYDGYDGTMVSSSYSNGDDTHRISPTSSGSSYPSDSDMAEAMPGESDADRKARRRRKVRMACGSIGGVVVGGLILGPLGAIAGGVGAGAATRAVSKRREKKKDERVANLHTSAVPIPMQRGEVA